MFDKAYGVRGSISMTIIVSLILTCLLWGWELSCLPNHLPPPENFWDIVMHLQQWHRLCMCWHLTWLLGPQLFIACIWTWNLGFASSTTHVIPNLDIVGWNLINVGHFWNDSIFKFACINELAGLSEFFLKRFLPIE